MSTATYDVRPAPLRPVGGTRTVTHRPASRRSRVTRRGRLAIVITLALLLLAAFSLGRVRSEATGSSMSPPSMSQMTVQPGDTLWSLARRLAPGSDPRQVVEQIRDINRLTDAQLRVGQQLLLPAVE